MKNRKTDLVVLPLPELDRRPHQTLQDLEAGQRHALHHRRGSPLFSRREHEEPHHAAQPLLPARVLLVHRVRQERHLVPHGLDEVDGRDGAVESQRHLVEEQPVQLPRRLQVVLGEEGDEFPDLGPHRQGAPAQVVLEQLLDQSLLTEEGPRLRSGRQSAQEGEAVLDGGGGAAEALAAALRGRAVLGGDGSGRRAAAPVVVVLQELLPRRHDPLDYLAQLLERGPAVPAVFLSQHLDVRVDVGAGHGRRLSPRPDRRRRRDGPGHDGVSVQPSVRDAQEERLQLGLVGDEHLVDLVGLVQEAVDHRCKRSLFQRSRS